MSKFSKIKYPFITAIIFIVLTNISFASDSIPTPPKRPDILNVSPAYIEELKNRFRPKKENEPKPIDKIKNTDTENIEKEIIDITDPKDLASILDKQKDTIFNSNDTGKTSLSDMYVPIPTSKPFPANIEPASGENKKKEKKETTLISFALKPQQINLNKSLEQFLQNHAVKLFNEDNSLKMEIYAYATPIEGEKHSEVRISLARALKIRSFLISHNIAPHRLKLSPMGVKGNEENADRVDLVFIKPTK